MDNINKDVCDSYANKAKGLTAGMQFALTAVLPNIVNGACWGFTSVADAIKHSEVLKADKNLRARKISGNACLLEVQPAYIVNAVSAVSADLINQKDLADMEEGMQLGIADCNKFLIKAAAKGQPASQYRVGIYCVNDSASITLKGVSYPAFRVNASAFCALCSKWGYSIIVNNKAVNPTEALAKPADFFESLTLSPSNTGLFVDIVSPSSANIIADAKSVLKSK